MQTATLTRLPARGMGKALSSDDLTRAERKITARHFHAQQVIKDLGLTNLGVSLLMAISTHEGRSLTYYAEALNVTAPVASRAMYDLTEKEARHGALELVERRPINDPETGLPNNRFKGHYLTPKGRKIVRRIVSIWTGEQDEALPLSPNNKAA